MLLKKVDEETASKMGKYGSGLEGLMQSMAYPKSLSNLIDNLKKLPGVGEKTAERMALAMLEFEAKVS